MESDDHPIGNWGRIHGTYLEEANPPLLNHLILTDKPHTYLADLNKQAQDHHRLIIKQLAVAEEIIKNEMINA